MRQDMCGKIGLENGRLGLPYGYIGYAYQMVNSIEVLLLRDVVRFVPIVFILRCYW